MSSSHLTKEGDNVYYNVAIAHDDSKGKNGEPTPAVYFEVRGTNLLQYNTDEYVFSVVRMKIPSSLIPIQIFPNDPNIDPLTPNAVNISLYTVTLSWNGINRQVPLIWIPQLQFPLNLIPKKPNEGIYRERYSAYYSFYSVEYFITLINTALTSAFNLIVSDGATITAPPFFNYNKETKLISLYVPDDYDTKNVDIFTNNFLNRNFGNGFNQIFYGYIPLPPDGLNNKFIINDTGLNTQLLTVPIYGANSYIVSTQEYNSISDMTSVQSIVLQSGNIPVKSEWISLQNTNITPGSNIQSDFATQDNFINIISDYEIDIVQGFEFRNNIAYLPTAEYRRASLRGNTPIYNIDIRVMWKDNYDNLYQLFIPSHDVLTIKMLFEKII